MARHVVVLLAALALIAGACSSSEPAASEPSPTPVADATPTPAPTATVTPTPQPTATAAPTPTPAPSEEELAVIAAWERYVVLGAEARSNNPSTKALDYESYMMGAAVQGQLDAVEQDRADGFYIVGPVGTSVTGLTFRPDGEVVVDACTSTNYVAHSLVDDSIVFEEGPRTYVTRGRLVFVADGWLVAARQSEAESCAP